MTVRRYTEIRSKAVRDGDDQPRKTTPKPQRPILVDESGPHLAPEQSLEEFCGLYQRCNW